MDRGSRLTVFIFFFTSLNLTHFTYCTFSLYMYLSVSCGEIGSKMHLWNVVEQTNGVRKWPLVSEDNLRFLPPFLLSFPSEHGRLNMNMVAKLRYWTLKSFWFFFFFWVWGKVVKSFECGKFFFPLQCRIVAAFKILFEPELGILYFVLRFLCFVSFEGVRWWGQRAKGRGRERIYSRLNTQYRGWHGLDLTTLRSWPEPKSRVGWCTLYFRMPWGQRIRVKGWASCSAILIL